MTKPALFFILIISMPFISKVSESALAMVALTAMTLDNIAIFFPSSVSSWFRFFGTIAAPLFTFCLFESYDSASDKRKFIKTLYIISVSMAVANVVFHLAFQTYGVEIAQNFYTTLFSLFYLIELTGKKGRIRPLILYLTVNVISSVLILFNAGQKIFPDELSQVLISLTGNFSFSEGGAVFVIFWLFVYKYKDSKLMENELFLRSVLFSYDFYLFVIITFDYASFLFGGIAECLAAPEQFLFYVGKIMGIPTFPHQIDYSNAALLMIFLTAPLLMKYNRKGNFRLKPLFDVYYPLHIYILAFAKLLFTVFSARI